jgi:hypothetical protein
MGIRGLPAMVGEGGSFLVASSVSSQMNLWHFIVFASLAGSFS